MAELTPELSAVVASIAQAFDGFDGYTARRNDGRSYEVMPEAVVAMSPQGLREVLTNDPDQVEAFRAELEALQENVANPAVALPLSRFIGLMTATKALTAAQAVEILKTSENPEIVLLRIMISGDGVMLDRDDPLVREGLQTLIDAELMDTAASDRVIAAWPTQA